jgi:primosomal protein N' (replication factor Y)
MPATVIAVALPVPVRALFDYLPPEDSDTLPQPGTRVTVPFGTRSRVGVVIRIHASPPPARRLKAVTTVHDSEPMLDARLMKLLGWAAEYYAHPPGEVIQHALPALLRGGRSLADEPERLWQASAEPDTAARRRTGSRQAALLEFLGRHPDGIDERLLVRHGHAVATLRSLERRGRVHRRDAPPPVPVPPAIAPLAVALSPAQRAAVETVAAGGANGFGVYLVNGVTGSGKTEVYLELVRRTVAAGRQALLLVPEIGLTPQLIDRVRRGVGAGIVVMHSGLPDGERLAAWRSARDGSAGVVIGTRSAVWTPLPHAGLIVVDEEHDLSYKQREGFRYSARDVAVKRARDAGIPVILGSATPALETLHNVQSGRYAQVRLADRAQGSPPAVRIVDLRGRHMHGAFSDTLLDAMRRELAAGHQVLVFLNRRGYSPVLMCHACGAIETCLRCDAPLTFHHQQQKLLCHHCGSGRRPGAECRNCGAAPLLHVGHGTERLEETLRQQFPAARILRVDRDSTRARGAFDRMYRAITAGDADLLIGTQMLAKGHDFPNLSLVGIVDADRGLFSNDFRAGERLAQLFVQVSGRAGRDRTAGTVIVQTHFPQHPLIRALKGDAYGEMAQVLLEERRAAQLPPFTYWAVLRAEDYRVERPRQFLTEARRLLERAAPGLELSGPHPAPVERRADRLRWQLIVQAASRNALNRAMAPWTRALEALKSARAVRWSLDIDPLEVL